MMIKKYTEKILFEGGNAFDNVDDFKGEEKDVILEKCVELMEDTFGFQNNNFSFVGSFRHKGSDEKINDVDIVVDQKDLVIDEKINNFDVLYEVIDNLESIAKKNKIKTHSSKPLGVLSLKYLIESDNYIQIDLIPVPSVAWGEFSYYSPSERESEYKGLYRNALLEAIAKSIHFNVEYFEDGVSDDNNVKSYFRYRYLRNLGLWKVKEEKEKKSDDEYVKDRDTYQAVTHDPQKIINILLGDYSVNQVYTFEDVFKIVTSEGYKHKDLIDDIFKYYEDYIVVRQNRKLPKPAFKYID